MPGIKQELPHQRAAEITIGQLAQQNVAKIPGVAQEGQIIGAAPPLALNFSRQTQPHLRLTDHIERRIGQRDVFFQHRRMAAPFAHPMTKDQGVVPPHPEQEFEQIGAHHIAPTSSGMSKKVGCR